MEWNGARGGAGIGGWAALAQGSRSGQPRRRNGAAPLAHAHAVAPTVPSATPPQVKTPERGFSSAKLLPGSRDSVVVALKSEENSVAGTQRTFITVMGENPPGSGQWRSLMEETELPMPGKFEGLEVIA